jgi:hypothetical protein
MPIAPARASPPAGIHGGSGGFVPRFGWSTAVAAPVVIVSLLEAGEPLDGVALAGANE